MSQAREIIHDIINSLSIGQGMARIVHSSLLLERELTNDEKIDKMKKVLISFEKLEKQITELRELAKQSNW